VRGLGNPDCGRPRCRAFGRLADHDPGGDAGLGEPGGDSRNVPAATERKRDHLRHRPELLEELEDDALLPFDAVRVDLS